MCCRRRSHWFYLFHRRMLLRVKGIGELRHLFNRNLCCYLFHWELPGALLQQLLHVQLEISRETGVVPGTMVPVTMDGRSHCSGSWSQERRHPQATWFFPLPSREWISHRWHSSIPRQFLSISRGEALSPESVRASMARYIIIPRAIQDRHRAAISAASTVMTARLGTLSAALIPCAVPAAPRSISGSTALEVSPQAPAPPPATAPPAAAILATGDPRIPAGLPDAPDICPEREILMNPAGSDTAVYPACRPFPRTR
jgi:hypothetical protein